MDSLKKVPFRSQLVLAFIDKMETEEAKEMYRNQGAVAEFANAWVKSKICIRQFRLRGLIKVGMEAPWACLEFTVDERLASRRVTLDVSSRTVESAIKVLINHLDLRGDIYAVATRGGLDVAAHKPRFMIKLRDKGEASPTNKPQP